MSDTTTRDPIAPVAADASEPSRAAATTQPFGRVDVLGRFLAIFGSYGFATVVLLLLLLLTYRGTIYQVEHGLFEAQQKYFNSLFLIDHWGPFGIPLPGAALLMALFAINLVIGGLIRIRKSAMTVGIMIAHVGILFMLVAGLVKFQWSTEGHLTLYEGETGAYYQSYHDWEIAIDEKLPNGNVLQHVVPHEDFGTMDADETRIFSSEGLPFELTVSGFLRNARPVRTAAAHGGAMGGAVDGFRLVPQPLAKEAERNVAGVYVTATELGGKWQRETGLLWALQRGPFVFEMAGRRFAVDLRHRRWMLPFRVHLDDAIREDHPGITMAKAFESEITVSDEAGVRPVRIKMNEPLRYKGYILFQSNMGPEGAGPRDRMFSGFSVVDNPADQWPLWSCIVISIGLVVHFLMKLFRYVSAENKRAARVS